MLIITFSPEETCEVGRVLGEACHGGEVILLEGDLGAGKTTFTQGLAVGLGIAEPVVSPTFIIMREYDGRIPLYHFDFYRLEGTGRAVDLEFEEYLLGGGVCVIEWPSCAPELVPDDYIHIAIEEKAGMQRNVTVEAAGERHQASLGRLRAALTPQDGRL